MSKYDLFNNFLLKMNLEKLFLLKWKVLKPHICLTFKVIKKEALIILYNEAIHMCKDDNNSVMILFKIMVKNILISM